MEKVSEINATCAREFFPSVSGQLRFVKQYSSKALRYTFWIVFSRIDRKVSVADIALEYRAYRDSDAEQVTMLLADVFSRHDPLAYGAHVTREEFAEFVRSLLLQADNDGLTIVACLPRTDEIVGVMLTNDRAADSAHELSVLNEKFRPIASILGVLNEIYLAGHTPRPGEMLHLYLLGVADRFAGQGIGRQLVIRTVEHGAAKGYRVAFAEATNRRSQHIFKSLEFLERAHIMYGEHVFEGQNPFAGIAEHGGPILMDKALAGTVVPRLPGNEQVD